ncbi:MAG: zf-HC2 domain-containing protein, partial [Kutzneria sp.]|nr:zf-HC2 domain-containing protein [Kutzneria sp.]
YLQVHLAESSARRCRATVDRLGAWTRSGLSKRETAQVEAHLDECDRCRALAAELADVNGALRAAVAPLVLGVGAAGYLATIGAGTAKAATVAAAGAGGAAGAASSLPRQLLGVAASTAALAAVVAIALTAGHSSPGPTAAPPPAASAQSPAQPPPRPPATSAVPAPTTPAPTTPAPTTPAPPTSTPATTLVPAPPAPPPTTPAGTATLVPTVPATPINLVPGGPPVDLPITVRNTGDATSDPVTMTLTLPNGVTAELTGAKPAARSGASDALTAEPDPSTPVVHCTGGTGTISCATEVGLAPGQAVTCTFALTADVAATGGQVTGTVSAGTSAAIQLGTVEVQVRQIDAVEVTATVWHPEFWLPRIDVAVTNRSTHAGQVTLTLDAPNGGWLFTFAPCRQYVLRISCVFDLDQGESTSLSVWLLHWWGHRDTVRVTATLGSAHQVVDVPVGCDPGPVIPPTPTIPVSPPPSPPVVSPPAVSPPAVTATPPAVSTPGSPRPSGPTTSLPVTTTSRGPTPPTGSPGRPR